MLVEAAQFAALLAFAEGASPQDLIAVPSGREIYWLETIRDVPDASGRVLRFRFVAPALAEALNLPEGPAGDYLTDEDYAELSGEEMFVAPEDIIPQEVTPVVPGSEAEADAGLIDPQAMPEEEFDLTGITDDPLFKDIVWLCENWVLPKRGSDPVNSLGRIIISISDRPIEFGTVEPGNVQTFEAFSVSEDNKSCVWEPW